MEDGIAIMNEINARDAQINEQKNRILSREKIYAPTKIIKLLIAKITNKNYGNLLRNYQLEQYDKRVRHDLTKKYPTLYEYETESALLNQAISELQNNESMFHVKH